MYKGSGRTDTMMKEDASQLNIILKNSLRTHDLCLTPVPLFFLRFQRYEKCIKICSAPQNVLNIPHIPISLFE